MQTEKNVALLAVKLLREGGGMLNRMNYKQTKKLFFINGKYGSTGGLGCMKQKTLAQKRWRNLSNYYMTFILII